MTLKELSQLYYLNREIERDQERLDALRERAAAAGAPNTDGMPKSPGYENRIEHYIAEIVDLEAIIRAKISLCMHERNRLERYIADIPDSLTRQIFALRFINGLSWVRVAGLVGGNNTEDSVKKTCYRFLEKSKRV